MLQLAKATCGDLQTCVSFQDAGDGVCRGYCDPANPVARGCGQGQECVQLAVGNASPPRLENVCVPIPIDEDASFGIEGGGSGGVLTDVIIQPDVVPDGSNTHQ
jgi:hypothetical protein